MCTCAHYILKFTTFIVPYILGLNTTLRLVLVEKITQACSCIFSTAAGTRIPTSAPLFVSFFYNNLNSSLCENCCRRFIDSIGVSEFKESYKQNSASSCFVVNL